MMTQAKQRSDLGNFEINYWKFGIKNTLSAKMSYWMDVIYSDDEYYYLLRFGELIKVQSIDLEFREVDNNEK